VTEQTSFKGLIPPPKTATGLYEWINKAYIQFNNMLRGKLNATIVSFTLDVNESQTLLQDSRIGGSTVVLFSPKTASAAAEIANGTLIVGEPVNGGVNIGHDNSAVDDRTFDIVIIG